MTRKQAVSLAASLAASLLTIYLDALQTGGPLVPTQPRAYVVAAVVFLVGTLLPRLGEAPQQTRDGALDRARGEHAVD